ncbi:hypothetical protein BVY04_00935, partial [bacterium M21]
DTAIQELRSKLKSPLRVARPGTSVGGPPPVPAPGGVEVMAWMVKVMLADGIIDAEEEKQLNSYAQQRQIPKSQIDSLIHRCQSGTLQTPVPKDATETQAWLASMARMALADGFVSKEEEVALMQLGKALNYGAYDIKRIIKEQRREMFHDAKDNLRQMKISSGS